MNDQQLLAALFSSSFVLGGSPCSGKSTLAERLASAYHLPYYKADNHMWRHLNQADPQLQPIMSAYATMSWDEIWSQPVNVQVADVFAYYTEQFPMILEDLLGYCDQGPIIMEGIAFLPELVHAWGVPFNRALFLVPDKAFQIAYYSQREWIQPILDSCRDPDQAFANWMERDHQCGLGILQQVKACEYQTIIVDESTNPEKIFDLGTVHFRLQ